MTSPMPNQATRSGLRASGVMRLANGRAGSSVEQGVAGRHGHTEQHDHDGGNATDRDGKRAQADVSPRAFANFVDGDEA